MGMIVEGDVVLAISNSGETEEILTLIPILKRIGVRLIAMTGNHRFDPFPCGGRRSRCGRHGRGLSSRVVADGQHHRSAGSG